MQKNKHIKALFFLGIFAMLLLHQVLPHWHHEHDVEHSHKAVALNDTHSHGHDMPEKESPGKGFLDMFLEMHVHSVVSNEVPLIHKISIKKIDVKKKIVLPFTVIHYYSALHYNEVEKIRAYHPPSSYFNTYLSSLESRGPPTC